MLIAPFKHVLEKVYCYEISKEEYDDLFRKVREW